MENNFSYADTHHCAAAVLMCVDFRFREFYQQALTQEYNLDTFDLWTVPGVAKLFLNPDDKDYLDNLLNKIEQVSIKLHDIKKIILLNHADCGAYGGRQAFASVDAETKKHQEDLQEAKNMLQARFPSLEIEIGYVFLNADKHKISLIKY